MKEPTKLTIGKHNYIIGSWDVDKALDVLVWLTKTFGEGFVTIFVTEEGRAKMQGIVNKEDSEDDEKGLVAEFTSKVIDRLDSKDYVKYSKVIVSGTKCNAADINFSHHFIGRLGELHTLMFHILRHQYADFLDGSADAE